MNKRLIISVITFLALMGVLLYAKLGVATPSAAASPRQQQQPNTQAATPPETTEAARAETEIRALLERYYEIARTGDREALKNFSREISAPEYLYSSELGVMDKQATLRHLEATDLKFVKPAFKSLTIQVHGADTAIAKYLDTSTVKINGLKMVKPTRYTNVWVRQPDGAWRIVAEHSSRAAPKELVPRHRFADYLASRR